MASAVVVSKNRMKRSADSGLSGRMGATKSIAGEEEEAVGRMRTALRNPHGTSAENRVRVFSAWQSLRSVATSPDVQSRSRKRYRKKSRLEDKVQRKKKSEDNDGDKKIEGGNLKSHPTNLTRDENKILHEAARLGQADRVREVISQGVNVSSKDNTGYSALHWASLYGHVEVVRTLLGLGAGDGKRINRQNYAGNTALHLACLGHHAEVAVMLRLYKPDEYLMNACDQTPISLGLRDLVDSAEKTQQLGNLQTRRANSHRHHLLSQSLDWRMGRDSDYAANDIIRESSTASEPARGSQGEWDDYNRAWTEFVERSSVASGTEDGAVRSKDPTINSSGVDTVDGIRFQDVPWPVAGVNILTNNRIRAGKILGTERLLLADLGLTGAALRPLIQRERLRWHPDKFVQMFGRRLALEESSSILAGVQTVIQLLNSLADANEEVVGKAEFKDLF